MFLSIFIKDIVIFLILNSVISKTFNLPWLKNDWFFRHSVLTKINQVQILHLTMYNFNIFESVDFWLSVIMDMRSYSKLDHTQTTYLWFSISLHIHKTDSEVKIRVHLGTYPTTPSASSISINNELMSWDLERMVC